MLEQKDLQSIGELLDKKLKTQKDEIVSEIGEAAGEAFSEVESKLGKLETKVDNLSKEMANRPTKTEISSWADRRIVDLELRADRYDYLHLNELDKLRRSRKSAEPWPSEA